MFVSMELRTCNPSPSAPTGVVPSAMDFMYALREEQIAYSLDPPAGSRQPVHDTSRQNYSPALIEWGRQ
jgi:hypothetical protein